MGRWKALIMLVLATGLTACSTTFVSQQQPKDFSKMYVMGIFTWWEADENYRLQPKGDKLFSVTTKLIADGQPYDFKFSDKHWTPEYSCGPESHLTLKLAKSVTAVCNNPSGNFQFTPELTGTYEIFIDFSDDQQPQVYIDLVKAD